jgi:RNA polymerase sigma factor (sigma-70 family)
MAQPDEQRFERFYYAHYDRVAAYLLSRARRDHAQDALARTFEVAWRRFAEIPEPALPWLLGVARRVLSEQRRAEGRRDALIERIAETVPAAGGDHAETLATRQLVASALAQLSEVQREAVLLVAWDGLGQQDAATVLGCSRVAFAVRLHRARARLRAEIAGNEDRATRSPPTVARPAGAPTDTTTSRLIEEAT